MAKVSSDINTDDEDNVKRTRHDRAAKCVTSDDEDEGEEDLASASKSKLPPLPDPNNFFGMANKSGKVLDNIEDMDEHETNEELNIMEIPILPDSDAKKQNAETPIVLATFENPVLQEGIDLLIEKHIEGKSTSSNPDQLNSDDRSNTDKGT